MPVRTSRRSFALPGGRFAVENAAQLPRLSMAVARLLGPHARRALRNPNRRLAERSWAADAVQRLGVKIDVSGLEHVDPGASYVVTPLHEGFADAPVLISTLPLPLRFAARTELVTWPMLGDALKMGGHVLVTPEGGVAGYREMLRRAATILDAGDSLVVFPQGTILGIEAAFTRGAFHVAAATRRPVLPVVITGTHRIWEHPYSPIVRFDQPVAVRVLPPVAPESAVASRRTLERAMKHLARSMPVAPRRFVPERDGWWDDYRYAIDPDFADLAARVARRRRTLRGLPADPAGTHEGPPRR